MVAVNVLFDEDLLKYKLRLPYYNYDHFIYKHFCAQYTT